MIDGQAIKEAMVKALKKLSVQKGFDKVTVCDITAACGLGRQSFYYHFEDKYHLLRFVLEQETFFHCEKAAAGMSGSLNWNRYSKSWKKTADFTHVC